MLALGIDLGTAYARAAIFRERGAELLQFPDGATSLPAVVAMGGGSTRVGRSALARATTHPDQAVRGIKRLLGRSHDDPVLQRVIQGVAYPVSDSGGGAIELSLGGRRYSPEAVAAALLAHLTEVAAERLGKRPTKVVLTSPYWYGVRQRDALKRAATLADLSVLQVISEGTATVLSLIEAEPDTRNVAIVDVGAGGCSASILEMGKAGIRLMSSGGDPLGGGEDVDHGLVRAVLKGIRGKVGAFPDSPAILELVRQVCEGAKRDISDASQVSAIIPFLPIAGGVFNQQVRIDRRSVEQLMADTTLRIGAACQTALQESGLSKSDLSAVYATGGMARLLTVRNCISAVLGEIASARLDPDGSVALGAAYQAGMLLGAVDSIPVIDVQTTLSVPPAAPGKAESLPPVAVMSMPPREQRASAPPAVDTGAFRVELAGLLASLRAGALTDGGQKLTQPTLLSRANDVIETDADDSPEANAAALAHLRGIWKQLALTMQTARQYQWEHPQTQGALEQVRKAIEAAVDASENAVRWDVRSARFSFRGEDVWKPDRPPYDRIPHELFADGVRKIQIRAGVTRAELRRLVGVLMRDPAVGFGLDDDSATALWESKFDHIAYMAVDAFSEADDPDFDEQRDELARELAKIANLDGDADSVLGAYTAAQREIAPQVDATALTREVRSGLEAGIDPGHGVWLTKFARSFANGYVASTKDGDGTQLIDALERYAAEQLDAKSPDYVFEVLGALTTGFAVDFGEAAARSFLGELVGRIFTLERLENLFSLLQAAPQLTPNLVTTVRIHLAALPDARFVAAGAQLYATLRPELHSALDGYLADNVAGNEAAFGELLAIGPQETAEKFLNILNQLGTPAAKGAIRRALGSPHPEVRMQALVCLPDEAPERLYEDVRRILEDPESSVRDRALQIIVKHAIVAAGPVLVQRVRNEDFPKLSLREQRLILEAIGSLNRERAESVGLELLERQSLLGSEDLELSRALAAEFLSQFDSEAVLTALRKVAKKRWFRSSPAQEAASNAVTGIEYRRSQSPVENKDPDS
jgi:hypothetical protein